MSESAANPGNNTSPAAHTAPDSSQSAQTPQKVAVDDTKASALYANFCRVTGTPEELIIDFGVNLQPFGVPTEPIVVSQRIIANLFTAKRLWQALGMTLQRYEATFGGLETDVMKRAATAARTEPGRGDGNNTVATRVAGTLRVPSAR